MSEYRVYRDLEEDVADLREGGKTESSERASIKFKENARITCNLNASFSIGIRFPLS